MCTGACLRAAARYCGELGLGPGPNASLPAGPAPAAPVAPQPPRTLPLCRGCYTYAYDMRNAIMICNFETNRNRTHTPRPETTRRPQFCKTRNIRIFSEYPG